MSPTRADLAAAAELLGCHVLDVPTMPVSEPESIQVMAIDVPCEVCYADAGEPCDMTVDH